MLYEETIALLPPQSTDLKNPSPIISTTNITNITNNTFISQSIQDQTISKNYTLSTSLTNSDSTSANYEAIKRKYLNKKPYHGKIWYPNLQQPTLQQQLQSKIMDLKDPSVLLNSPSSSLISTSPTNSSPLKQLQLPAKIERANIPIYKSKTLDTLPSYQKSQNFFNNNVNNSTSNSSI